MFQTYLSKPVVDSAGTTKWITIDLTTESKDSAVTISVFCDTSVSDTDLLAYAAKAKAWAGGQFGGFTIDTVTVKSTGEIRKVARCARTRTIDHLFG